MRYLVRARVKPGFEKPLLQAIERRTLGRGSIAGGEYLRNMTEARQMPEGEVRWVAEHRETKRAHGLGLPVGKPTAAKPSSP